MERYFKWPIVVLRHAAVRRALRLVAVAALGAIVEALPEHGPAGQLLAVLVEALGLSGSY